MQGEVVISSSTIRLLRLPFSVFLSPIYFFALALQPVIHWPHAILVFVILHCFIYPASNGYNSYMDRDTGPIGGLEKPPSPSRELYRVSIALDLIGILLGLLISPWFALILPFYIGASKAYSYRGIRLKKYPVLGYLTVILVQGGFTFWLVFYGSSLLSSMGLPWLPMLACTFLIGGFYPLTQVYQHRQDAADGVYTISYVLGYRGTFVFCGIMYLFAYLIMAQLFIHERQEPLSFVLLSVCLIPVVLQFVFWARKVWRDTGEANFRNTMRMTWVAAISINLAFIILLIRRWFD